MWIGILVIVVGGLYLAWCLADGRIVATLGTDLRKKTSLVDRETNPTTFWIAWVASAGALVLFAAYLIRTALS
jgi:Gpi18-like mannosyltransferase